jgi:hypothetical protein
MTAIELAGFVGGHLARRGVRVVLSGGACVSYYSNGQYVSMDLDFVNTDFASRRTIRTAMAGIGFREDNRYFRHPETEFFVEFPLGPISIGAETVSRVDLVETPAGKFNIISPTDCVKDRLAGFYFWDDLPSLEQAVLVAR